MRRTNIYLDDDQLWALKLLASEDGQSVATQVRRAVDSYLQHRLADDERWHARLNAVVTRLRSRIPSTLTPDEIEADITAAREDFRRVHRAARGR